MSEISSAICSPRRRVGPSRGHGASQRQGMVMIEFAAILPVLFLLIIGSVEICNTIYLKQFITEIAYQGALEACRSSATESDVTSSMRNYLDTRGLEGAAIVVQGLDGTAFDLVSSGQRFEVGINVGADATTSGFTIRKFVDLSGRCVGVRQ